MIEIELMPVVVEAHRRDLRRLYQSAQPSRQQRTLRQRFGAFIVRIGRWVEDRYDEVATEPPATPSSQQA